MKKILVIMGLLSLVTSLVGGCVSPPQKQALTDDAAQIIVVSRLTGMAQTPEAKEYIGLLFPPVGWTERDENLKAWKYIVERWPSTAQAGFEKATWFKHDFTKHFSVFVRPTWVIFDDGKITAQAGALLIEANIETLNKERMLGKSSSAMTEFEETLSGTLFVSDAGRSHGGFTYNAQWNAVLKAHGSSGTLELVLQTGLGDALSQHEFSITDFAMDAGKISMKIDGKPVVLPWQEKDIVWNNLYDEYFVASLGSDSPPEEIRGTISPADFPGLADSYYVELRLSSHPGGKMSSDLR